MPEDNNFAIFAKDVNGQYSKERKMCEFTICKTFDRKMSSNDSDFVRIEVRQELPRDIFHDAFNKVVSHNIAREIAFRERDYVIAKLLELKEGYKEITDFEQIKKILRPSPSDKTFFAFMGIKNIALIGEQKNIRAWYGTHPVFEKGGDFLILPTLTNSLAKIIWVADEIIGNNMVIFPREDITIIQKKSSDMLDVPEHINYSSSEEPLGVYIDRSKIDLDVYVKSVIKLKILDKKEIHLIKVNI